MKKIITGISLGALIVLGVSVANAEPITLTDTDTPNGTLNNGNPSVIGTFDFTGAAGWESDLTAASVEYSFKLTGVGGGKVKFIEADVQFGEGNPFSVILDLGSQERAVGAGIIFTGTINQGPVLDALADGKLEYKIVRIGGSDKEHGNIKFGDISMTVNFTPPPPPPTEDGSNTGNNGLPVPDGGTTMMLLGMGCMLAESLRRRLAK
jgi:hypothetical protein